MRETIITEYRAELWELTGKLPISDDTDLKIGLLLKNTPKKLKEMKVKEILGKIRECKTESEVKKALDL